MTSGEHEEHVTPLSLFARVVVGVDGSEPSLEACRQAARLVDPGGSIELLTAVRLADAALTGHTSSRAAEDLRRDAEDALSAAKAEVGGDAGAELLNGPPIETMRRELERRRATLVALGTHGRSRASEIVLGGVAGDLLHSAPCSVLVARPPDDPAAFPRAILAGIDGSAPADAALDVALQLARRFDVPLRVITALGGRDVDLEHARVAAPYGELLEGKPATVLVEAAAGADLLVVGSRGLHGLRALGSVSERVAHRGSCSTLVVRSAKAEAQPA